ncbi:MAG: chemotaxis protein CheX [Nitrospira sp.]|nr:chemotaxis protein CheX [bacterium]MBL7049332.1 chemotaxis protein CheX [Nitrospira sp.]
MKAEFINPFLEALLEVLSTMAMTNAVAGKPSLKDKGMPEAKGDVSGIIGMASEQTKGSLAITFTEAAILDIASKMLCEKIEVLDSEVADMVGEITNMVCGGAKMRLSEKGYKFDLAIPTMVMGKNHVITHKSKGPVVIIPFKIEAGEFFVEISFE